MRRIISSSLFFLTVVLVLMGCATPAPTPIPATATTGATASSTLTVAAAADLTFAFQELGRLFEQETGTPVLFNFGSTGLLAQQIEQGAPIDLFAAANVSFVDELIARKRILADTKELYAVGRITIWTRQDSGIRIGTLQDLALPQAKFIAIANPDHAPYGIAAREALQAAGIWNSIQPKLVLGDNAMATLQYAERDDVDVAIVPLSLSVQSQGHWVLIPAAMHKPINQALGVVEGTRHEEQARAFAKFINSPTGRSIMKKYGFILPGESPLP